MLDTKDKGAILPTYFIGLGGTGKEILLRLRRKFFEQFGEPGLPCVGYLWLDTDTRAVGVRGERLDEIFDAVSFGPHEAIALLEGTVGSDVGEILRDPGRYEYIHKWLYKEVDQYGTEIKDGAGNVRTVGRLAFYSRYSRIRSRLEERFREICSQSSIEKTKKQLAGVDFVATNRVILVGSVVGGTGSGILLDTAFLIRDLKQARTIENIEQIISIAVLPNVFYPSPSDEVSKRSYGNSYAALKELEYYTLRRNRQGIGGGDDISLDYQVEWSDGEEKFIQGPPLNISYLIESVNAAQIGLTPDNRSELFQAIADSLFLDFLPGEFSNNKRSDYSNVAEHLASENAAFAKTGGTEFYQYFAKRYASFGFSKIEVPEDQLCLACSSQLARDILVFLNRVNHDPHIKESVSNGMAGAKLDEEGLIGRFGNEWKGMLRNRIATIVSSVNPANPDIAKLNSDILKFEKEFLFREGTDQTKWGNITSFLRGRTPQEVQAAESDLFDWLRDCIDRPNIGLNLFLREGGYLDQLRSNLEVLYKFTDDGQKPVYDSRIDRARKDSEFYKRRIESLSQQIKEADKNKLVKFLGKQQETMGVLLQQLKDAATQWALADAEICLLEQAKQVAKRLVDFSNEKRVTLRTFYEKLEPLAAHFLSRKSAFLNFGGDVLSIRFFDERKDWGTFYTLGKDESGNAIPVNPQRKSGEFIETNFDPTKGLWGAVEFLAREGQKEFSKKLRDYCEVQFRNDFVNNARLVEVIKHPQMKERWKDRIEKLVRTALPLARIKMADKKTAYLGVYTTKGDDYESLISEVRQRLTPFGFGTGDIEIHKTGKPSEVYLYTVWYAFPLAYAPLISETCHPAYYGFCQDLRKGQISDRKHLIPLHIDKRWEGKFGDLKEYDQRERLELKDATEILLLGSILGVVDVLEKGGSYDFALLREMFDKLERNPILGPYYEAMEFLRQNPSLRQVLRSEVNQRKNNLTDPQLRLFYWCLAYLYYNNDMFPSGSVEKSILEGIHEEISGRVNTEQRKEWDRHPTLSDLDKSRANLGGDILWIKDFPYMKELKRWVKK